MKVKMEWKQRVSYYEILVFIAIKSISCLYLKLLKKVELLGLCRQLKNLFTLICFLLHNLLCLTLYHVYLKEN